MGLTKTPPNNIERPNNTSAIIFLKRVGQILFGKEVDWLNRVSYDDAVGIAKTEHRLHEKSENYLAKQLPDFVERRQKPLNFSFLFLLF